MDKGHEALNRFLLLGTIERVKAKKNGSRVLYLRASHRPDKMLTGAVTSPTFFTGLLILRISGAAIEYGKISEASLAPGTEVFVEGHVQGIGHKINGEDYFTIELWAHRIRRVRPPAPSGDDPSGEDEDPDQEAIVISESQESESVVVEGEGAVSH